MMRRFDVCLNLVVPDAIKDPVLDHFLKHPEQVGPFTMHRVEGHGDPDNIATPSEQVRGRAERIRIEILMEASRIEALLAPLRGHLPHRETVWWVTPVLQSSFDLCS